MGHPGTVRLFGIAEAFGVGWYDSKIFRALATVVIVVVALYSLSWVLNTMDGPSSAEQQYSPYEPDGCGLSQTAC